MSREPRSDPGNGVGRVLYRFRGWVPVVPILVAVLLAQPRSPWLPLGLGMMGVGEAVRLWGAAYLGRTARSSRFRTAKLVTGGPFAFTRHPLYWGNFLLTMGFALVSGVGLPWFPILSGLGFLILYIGHLRREESALSATYPEIAGRYYTEVPRFRWRLTAARCPGAGDPGKATLRRAVGVEAWTLHAEVWILIAFWIRTHWGPEFPG